MASGYTVGARGGVGAGRTPGRVSRKGGAEEREDFPRPHLLPSPPTACSPEAAQPGTGRCSETTCDRNESWGKGGQSSRDTQDTWGGTGSRLAFAPSRAVQTEACCVLSAGPGAGNTVREQARCRELAEQRAWCGRDGRGDRRGQTDRCPDQAQANTSPDMVVGEGLRRR